MNRKDFLKNCACGLCTCAAAGLISPATASAAETATKDDWKTPFLKQRFAKLLEILAGRLDEKTLNEILLELGRNCSSSIAWIKEYHGDPDGYFKRLKQRWNEDATCDREKGVITVASAERTDCGCPLMSNRYTPKLACNCSLGWQQQTFETILGGKVRVELKESLLRGGKRCIFEIHVNDVLSAKAPN